MPRILRITALTVVALLACVTAPGYAHAVLERVLRPCGYTDSLGNDYFYIRDYLGNVRSVIDSEGYLVEINDYYPYGALMNTLADNPSRQPYKYGGKELDRTAGLDLYDSRARQYDPILGRTTTPDPRSSSYFPLSHYVWCAANPVNFIDKYGEQPVKYIDGNGIKHIDWSVVVMVKALSPNANEDAKAKHENLKNAITKELESEFNSFLNGDGNGVKNSDGEIVVSTFHIHVVDVDNTSCKITANRLSKYYSQEIKDNQPGKQGMAAVFMDGSTNGQLVLADKSTYITISPRAPYGTRSHELYHTTGVHDNGYINGGVLNSTPKLIAPHEVDMMWELIPEKK